MVVFGLYIGLRAAFPDEGSALYLVFRAVRYGLVGVWARLGAPWLFCVLRLAPRMGPEDHAAAAGLGGVRCLRNGTATVADSGPTGAAAKALRATGLRGIVRSGTCRPTGR